MRACQFCGRELAHHEGYQRVTGWVAVDKRDSITLRKDAYPPAFACRSCIRLQQMGGAEQGKLA